MMNEFLERIARCADPMALHHLAQVELPHAKQFGDEERRRLQHAVQARLRDLHCGEPPGAAVIPDAFRHLGRATWNLGL